MLGPQPFLDSFAREAYLLMSNFAALTYPEEKIKIDGKTFLNAFSLLLNGKEDGEEDKRVLNTTPWTHLGPECDAMEVVPRLRELEKKLQDIGSYTPCAFLEQHGLGKHDFPQSMIISLYDSLHQSRSGL